MSFKNLGRYVERRWLRDDEKQRLTHESGVVVEWQGSEDNGFTFKIVELPDDETWRIRPKVLDILMMQAKKIVSPYDEEKQLEAANKRIQVIESRRKSLKRWVKKQEK